jgi:hypothetical protein
MIVQIAYSRFFGLPIVAYLGFTTLFLLLSTATIGYLTFKGNTKISFKWHPRLAAATITIAIIHAIFALSAYLRY